MIEQSPATVVHGTSLLSDHDIYLFKEGSHFRLYDKLGSHAMEVDGTPGVLFAVWAPNARHVSVMGDFNQWKNDSHQLNMRSDDSGIWEGFIPHMENGSAYKYHIVSRYHGYEVDKGDPFAECWETAPKTASRIWDLDYRWQDEAWMETRTKANKLAAPMSVYEVHLGSWQRAPERGDEVLSYRDIAPALANYVNEMGFTHVELLPVTEHPFYGSWGYQTTGYFAPTSRYGTPQDFMYMVDLLHQHGISVILDWVPSHFPDDAHGLSYFDGTHLYEHADPKQGYHPEWKSSIFNYGRNEVRSFLGSSAMFWLEKYHLDGLRVDAVASMLYLDYGRKSGEWVPNAFGGKENLGAVEFLRNLNETIYRDHPETQTIAEESTSWPMVSRPIYLGGLGFGMKWNMGWMHDTLSYFAKDPMFRKYQHDQLTFSIWYAFAENFVLPISHDEVVHGKGSMIGKMPGDEWQRFANLRALYGYMYGHPGKKLLFMGCEFAQVREWNHDSSLDWHLMQYAPHQGMHDWVRDLNHVYRKEPALYELDFSNEGFEWIDTHHWEESILCFLRKSTDAKDMILVACNFTPIPRPNYRAGVPRGGWWQELLNSDATLYGGSGQGNLGGLEAAPVGAHGRPHSITMTLPPMSVVFFKSTGEQA